MKEKKAAETQNVATEQEQEMYASFCTRIVADGFVPAEVLRNDFGDETYTKCIAVLFRTWRLLRECRRKWTDGEDTLGYEWADARFSQAQMKKAPPALAFLIERFTNKGRNKYEGYVRMRVQCRYTNKAFGAMPRKEASGDELNSFDRNGSPETVVFPAYCLRAMASKALPMIGKEAAIARRIGFAQVVIKDAKLNVEVRPIIDEDGRTGLGLKRSESLPAGTEFVIDAQVPTSALNPQQYMEMLVTAGQFVRLSPARSSGFGDFEVVGVLD